MLHRQRRHWEQRDPFLISSFEVNHPRCEDILRRQSPVSQPPQQYAACMYSLELS